MHTNVIASLNVNCEQCDYVSWELMRINKSMITSLNTSAVTSQKCNKFGIFPYKQMSCKYIYYTLVVNHINRTWTNVVIKYIYKYYGKILRLVNIDFFHHSCENFRFFYFFYHLKRNYYLIPLKSIINQGTIYFTLFSFISCLHWNKIEMIT